MSKKIILLVFLISIVFCGCYHDNNSTTQNIVSEEIKNNQSEAAVTDFSSFTKETFSETKSQTTTLSQPLQSNDSLKESSINSIESENVTLTVSSDFVEYKSEQNGVLLEVSAPKTTALKKDFYVTAKVTNKTTESISYVVSATENMHQEIDVKIKNADGKSFIDKDTFGIPYDTGMRRVFLNPGECYTQKICFIPGWANSRLLGLEGVDINYFEKGTYSGEAIFKWYPSENEETLNTLSLKFPITIA